MAALRQFGTELSGNRRRNGEFTADARMFMAGAAAAGEKYSDIAAAFGTDRR
jgi:hypothetical protein